MWGFHLKKCWWKPTLSNHLFKIVFWIYVLFNVFPKVAIVFQWLCLLALLVCGHVRMSFLNVLWWALVRVLVCTWGHGPALAHARCNREEHSLFLCVLFFRNVWMHPCMEFIVWWVGGRVRWVCFQPQCFKVLRVDSAGDGQLWEGVDYCMWDWNSVSLQRAISHMFYSLGILLFFHVPYVLVSGMPVCNVWMTRYI